MKKSLTIKDFPIYPEHIKWSDVEKILGKRKYKKFCKYMEGQTCIEEGVYPCDLAGFLANRGIWD